MSPEHAWSALAAEIGGRRRVRVSRDGGRTYPRRFERTLTDELPNQPAAVLLYDQAGCARTFCLDLDTSRGGLAAVDADLATAAALLQRHGAAWFADRSPNGGVHVYVPLEQPVPFHDAAALARGLARRTRHGFVLGPASLNNLAERFGIDEQIRVQLTKYREERRAWWALLGIIRLGDAGGTRGHYGPAPPPPDDVEPYTLLDMLGAHVIDEERTA